MLSTETLPSGPRPTPPLAAGRRRPTPLTCPPWALLLAVFSLLSLPTAARAEDHPQDAALGARVYAESCTRCHEAPDPASRDGRAWRAISLHMRLVANIPRQEQSQLLAFLRTYNTAAIPKPEAPSVAAPAK